MGLVLCLSEGGESCFFPMSCAIKPATQATSSHRHLALLTWSLLQFAHDHTIMPPKRNTKAEKPATDSPEKNNNNKNKNNNDKSPQPASTDDRPAEEPNDNSADTSSNPEQKEPTGEETKETTTEPAEDDNAAKARQRQERFKALQARAVSTYSYLQAFTTA